MVLKITVNFKENFGEIPSYIMLKIKKLKSS